MRNSYRKLKVSILLQSVLVTALAVFVGGVLLNYVVEGPYGDHVFNGVIHFLTVIKGDRQTALEIYQRTVGENKTFFITVGFLLLFALFFYVALTKMTKYLIQIEMGIDNIGSDSKEPVQLITELKPIEIRMNEIKAKLKRQELDYIEGEQRKTDLVLFLAHDLKTPLTSVVAYLSMLESHPEMPEEERRRYTKIALDKALRLRELTNEFFDIAKYNLKDIELETSEIDFSLMMEQLADELYGVLQEKNLECEVEVEDDLLICGDPDKLARVFDNIFRNAIAYCDENSTIDIKALKDGKEVKVIISNEGEKIPGDMLQTIFEKFYRVDNSRASGTGGAGLGLAIAKEIVEMHGGRILAISNDMKTQFIVSLPLKAEETEEALQPPPGRKKKEKRKKVK